MRHLQDCHGIDDFGIAKTLQIAQKHFWWRGMTEHLKAALLDCRECQTMLVRFNEPKELHSVAVKGIYNTVGIDLIGPVQTSAKGNRYIITCVDYLTKYVEARAVPNKASDTVADFFWEDIICRHDNVATVISDRGGELSGSFEALLDRCFIDHCLTSPHHPQSNGLTKRFNETLTIALHKMVADHPENWDMHLPANLMGYRGSIQASTRFSPFYLLHGYEMPLPVRSLDPIPPPACGQLGQTAQASLQGMRPTHTARIAAHNNIGQAQERNKRSYARRTNHSAAPTAASQPTAEDKGKSHVPPVLVRPDGTIQSLAAEPYSPPAEAADDLNHHPDFFLVIKRRSLKRVR